MKLRSLQRDRVAAVPAVACPHMAFLPNGVCFQHK
jgi:hypothetical protein